MIEREELLKVNEAPFEITFFFSGREKRRELTVNVYGGMISSLQRMIREGECSHVRDCITKKVYMVNMKNVDYFDTDKDYYGLLKKEMDEEYEKQQRGN